MKYELSINWPGLAAGALMLVLPFAGAWWVGSLGTGAIEIALSPFDMRISAFGTQMSLLLVDLFLLATKITFIIAGVFLVLASAFPRRWWSRPLMRFGVMKPFWSVIGLVITLAVVSIIVNMILPHIISGFSGGAAGGLRLSIPFVVGASSSTFTISNATITAPVTFSLTGTFWFAAVTAGVGIVARIYHRMFREDTEEKKKQR
jgi:hypothetical protein